MDPGTSGSMEIKEEPMDNDHPLKNYGYRETEEPLEFETVKVEQNDPEPIIEKEAESLRLIDDPLTAISATEEKTTSMKMSSGTLENIRVNEELLKNLSRYQDTNDLSDFEDIKVEPYYPKPSCSLFQPIIKEKAEIPKRNGKPMTLLSTSRGHKTSKQKKYSIVDLIKNNGNSAVVVVPHKWLHDSGNFCFYPKEGALKSVVDFDNPDDTWDFLPCIPRKTFDSYGGARQRLRNAKDPDGLESATEQGRGKRKRFANSKYMANMDNSDVDNPSFNNNYAEMRNRNIKALKLALKRKTEDITEKKKSKIIMKSTTRMKAPQTNKETKTTEIDELANAKIRTEARAQIMAAHRAASKSKLKTAVIPSSSHEIPTSGIYPEANTLSGCTSQEGGARHLNPFQSDLTLQLQSLVNLKEVPTAVMPACTSVNSAVLEQGALLQLSKVQESQKTEPITDMNNDSQFKPSDSPTILESLRRALNGIWSAIESLTKTQEIVIRTQANLDSKVDKLLRNVRATDSCKKPLGWPEDMPLESLAEMYKFENNLHNTDFMDFAVDYFSNSGGKTSEETARAVCIRLFSKSLASTINLKGTSIKTGIKNLKILKMIMDACMLALNKKFIPKNARSAVGVWLRNQSTKEEYDEGDTD